MKPIVIEYLSQPKKFFKRNELRSGSVYRRSGYKLFDGQIWFVMNKNVMTVRTDGTFDIFDMKGDCSGQDDTFELLEGVKLTVET